MSQWEGLGSTLEMDESLKGRISKPVLLYKSGISSPYPGTISPVSEIDLEIRGTERVFYKSFLAILFLSR